MENQSVSELLPREKLLLYGVGSLSDIELLALFYVQEPMKISIRVGGFFTKRVWFSVSCSKC